MPDTDKKGYMESLTSKCFIVWAETIGEYSGTGTSTKNRREDGLLD